MSIDDFLGRLEGVESTGEGKWVARCPAHDDSNPSLGVAVGSDGRILVKCYAGCTTEAVMAAMGLKMCDLMPEGKRPKGRRSEKGDGGKAERKALGVRKGAAKGKAKAPPAVSVDDIVKPVADNSKLPIKPTPAKRDYGRLVASYDYQDESGAVVFRVERRVKADGKKTFIQLHPDPSSKYGWSWGLRKAGVKRVPFRLPKVIAAAKAGKSVVIVEGEKDVLSVERALGCVATCNPGGAGKWEEGWGKYFKGCRAVAIIADKDPFTKKNRKTGADEPFAVGQRHACKVEALLRADGYDGSIRKFFMPDVAGEHVKDFTDWVEAVERHGGKADKSAFQKVINEFPGWPEEWEFDGADLVGVELAAKTASSSASDSVAGAADKEEAGRFGAPAPRAPGDDVRRYAVDFDIGSKRVKLTLRYGWTPDIIFAYSVAEVSRVSPNGELPKGVAARLKAWSATLWLIMRGSFFWHNDYRDFATCMFLDRDAASCRLMRVMSDEFFAFIGKAAKLEDVEPKRGDLAKILGLVKQVAVSDEYSQGVVPSNSWDRRGDAVYISSGDTEMCRIKGGVCEMVQNGTDGVVFLRGKTLAPWKLTDGGGVDPFATAKIFTGASFADAHGAMNVRLWVLNLFAAHATKPPLLITGGAGSGKTRMAKGIKEILGIRQDGALDLSVQQIEDGDKGLDAFWTTVNDGKLEVFDNFDTKVKWASDTLQNAATDGQTKRRTLYTTEGVSILKANASLILTSNNPIFSTEGNGGLADRLITIPLTLNRTASVDRELSVEIAENRDRYLTWMARTVAKALLDSSPVDASVNRRHPDYGEFSVRIGRALGCEAEVIEAMGSAEADKALLPLQNDAITKEVLAVLKGLGWKWSGTSGEMSGLIIARQGDDADEKTAQIYSSRRVGKAFSKYQRQLAVLFRMADPRIVTGKTVYGFDGLTTLGSSVVGLVGLEGQFPKSAEGAGVCGFTGNGALNPPNPPQPPTRAGACDVPPSLVEEDIEEKDMESYGDLEF